MGGHKSTAKWFDDVTKITIEKISDDKAQALIAERAAIKAERPRWNVVHTGLPAVPVKTFDNFSGADRHQYRYLVRNERLDELMADAEDESILAGKYFMTPEFVRFIKNGGGPCTSSS